MGEFDAPLQPLRDVSSVPLGGSLLDTLVQQDSSKTDTGLPGWHVETYAFPAAYPRSAAGSIIDATEKEARAPSSADAKASDKPVKQSKAEVEAAVEETWNRQKAARQYPPDANSSNGPNPLYIAVKRYYRTASKTARGKDGLTLVLAHANGFPKEVRMRYLLLRYLPDYTEHEPLADLGTDIGQYSGRGGCAEIRSDR